MDDTARPLTPAGDSPDQRDTPAAYRALGPLRREAAADNSWRFAGEDGTRAEVSMLADDLVRVRLLPPGREPVHSWFVARDEWPAAPVEVTASDDGVRLTTAACEVEISTEPRFRVSFAWPATEQRERQPFAVDEGALGMGVQGGTLRCHKRLWPGERIFGAGERTGAMDRRGQRIVFWNTDPPTPHGDATGAMHVTIPFWLSLRGGMAHGILLDSAAHGELDAGAAHPDRLSFATSGGDLTYYVFAGPTPGAVLARYADLTGHMPLPPRWALGYQQRRWSYYPAAHLREVAREFRARRIPCDVLYLDIDYMDGFRDFTFSPARYPDPAGLLAELAAEGFKVVPIIDPGIKRDPTDATFAEGLAHDAFCRLPSGALFTGSVWPGACVFPDFSQAAVRAWWGERHRTLVEAGVAGIWNDMNEPALTAFLTGEEPVPPGATLDPDVVHRAGGADGPPLAHAAFHNAYGVQMARATHEGLARLRPGERPFVLSRSGSAGIQRYAAVWTGDNTSLWAHLRMGLRMCLGLSLSGVAFAGADVGGFWGDATGEMLVRFTQLGALLPFFRNHSARRTHPQEPWAFGQPYEAMCRAAIELRYRLLPYLYTCFERAAQDGRPIAAPLLFAQPEDEAAARCDDQFLLGDDLLVAPVLDDETYTRSVYFPDGVWVDWANGQRITGRARATQAAPLDALPLFVREGAIIALGPVLQHTDERPSDPITLACYLGATDGATAGTLYEDDGHSTAYQQRASRRTAFHATRAGERIVLRADPSPQPPPLRGEGEPEVGGYDPGPRRWMVELHLPHSAAMREIAVRRVALDGTDLAPATETARDLAVEVEGAGWAVAPRRYESVVRIALGQASAPFTLTVDLDAP